MSALHLIHLTPNALGAIGVIVAITIAAAVNYTISVRRERSAS